MKKNCLAWMIIAGFATLACSLSIAPADRTSPAPPATEAQSGIPFFASPVTLEIPNGLASSARADGMDLVTDQTGAPWEVGPAHLQITLQDYSLASSSHVPQIFVYPAPEYAAENPGAAESLKRLQTILSNPGGQYTNDQYPHVPFFNAGQVFAAQEKTLSFNGGSGIRFVTQYAQDISPINNGGVFYLFEGLSSDGKYYMIAILPVNLPFLPADNNPDSLVPSGGIAFPQNNAPGLDFDAYFKKVTQLIDTAPSGQFSPPLNTLDTLIQSISIQ